jgi:hypothetical protein
MTELADNAVGANWLIEQFGLQLISDLPVHSRIGTRRTTTGTDIRHETYLEAMRPADAPAAHLQFHLRHEVPHLELLSRLFAKSGPAFVQEWINPSPQGSILVVQRFV